jgi:hypothetical protein
MLYIQVLQDQVGLCEQLFTLCYQLRSWSALVRAALHDEHDFVFVDGNVPSNSLTDKDLQHLPSALDFAAVANLPLAEHVTHSHLGYWPTQSGDSRQYRQAYHDFRTFIQIKGPFDGLLGFSEGASVAATILIEDARRQCASLKIRCAIFFCGVSPLDLDFDGTNGGIRLLEPATDGVLLHIPTAHIWCDDSEWPTILGKDLATLCDASMSEHVVHKLGHNIPGSRSEQALRDTVRAVRRTIERGKTSL